MRDLLIVLMVVASVTFGLYFGYEEGRIRQVTQEEPAPPPPTCIESRGPATDPDEHAWSMECYRISMQAESWGTFSWFQEQCIESACIAFRGLP